MEPAPLSPATDRPIFVVGSMGSGTTLMRLVLDSHEHLAIAQETGFARAVLANKWIPYWKHGGEWYGRLGMSDADLNAELRRTYGGMFQRFAEQHGKQRWGDKTPWHLWHMKMLSEVWPEASFVGTLRHPGAVASSQHNRFGWDWRRSVRHWVRSNVEMAWMGSQLGERFVVARYEDYVVDLESTIRPLLEWLGEPWSPLVLQHHVVQAGRGTSTAVEGHSRADDPVDPARATKWLDTMDAEGWRELRKQTTDLCEFFGYSLDEPAKLAPLGEESPAPMQGPELAKRVDEFAGRIDWQHRPKPIAADLPLKNPPRSGAAKAKAAEPTSREAARTLLAAARRKVRRATSRFSS